MYTAGGERRGARYFYELVRQMRSLQKEYFRTRRRDVLAASKDIERQVDAIIDRTERKLGNRTEEGDLFD